MKLRHIFALAASAVLLWGGNLEAATRTAAAPKPAEPAAASEYVVVVSEKTKALPEWMSVANALAAKHNATVITYKNSLESTLPLLKKTAPRMMSLVAPPEEVDRVLVNSLHRVNRQIDSDPYGDCIWGIVTGYTPADAMRIVNATEPLIIKKAEGTSNFDHSRFSDSLAITDWAPFQIMEQHGYKEPEKQSVPETPEGMAFKFSEFWAQYSPQYIVTSSHATQYNLEMPFSKGLIVSFGDKFHVLNTAQLRKFASFLKGVIFDGKEEDLANFLKEEKPPIMPPNAEPKVWVAAGNCLFGNANKSPNSMVVTALSAYGCNQVAGYTVTSWYGAAGWGTHSLMFDNHDASSLAEAWYLNNQFILAKTHKQFPGLAKVNFNASDLSAIQKEDPGFMPAMAEAGHGMGKDQMGLVYDRDTFAFYGDPAWVAKIDESRVQSPWHITWNSAEKPEAGFTISANKQFKGKFAVWLPKRVSSAKAFATFGEEKKNVDEIGLFTNDFILIDELDLPKGGKVAVSFE